MTQAHTSKTNYAYVLNKVSYLI